MDEVYLSLILPSALNFAPRGWAFCNGQLLNIQQYAALYSLLGTRFGGDGVKTFGLPNLSGRVPQNASQYLNIGEKGGNTTATLTQTITHTHAIDTSTGKAPTVTGTISVAAVSGTVQTPSANDCIAIPSTGSAQVAAYVDNPAATVPLASGSVSQTVPTGATGTGGAFSVVPPYIALNYIICISGLYPPRP